MPVNRIPPQWLQAAMGGSSPGGPIVLPGQAPPAPPAPTIGGPQARAAFGGYERLAELPGYMRSMWQTGRPVYSQPGGQQQQSGYFMPTRGQQEQEYLIETGQAPRAQQPQQPPGIMDWARLAMDLKSAADRREQNRLSWENTSRQLDEMMRQFEITSGGLADYRQGQLGMQQAQLGQQYAQMQQTGAYQQQGLQQRWAEMEMQRQQQAALLQQRQREMGAGIGQQIAGLQSQNWAQGMPFALPKGTMFAPGMGPGGVVSEMARRSGVSYTPPRLAKTPPPSHKAMEEWINSAIAAFGGG